MYQDCVENWEYKHKDGGLYKELYGKLRQPIPRPFRCRNSF
jgi:hypothetical protein